MRLAGNTGRKNDAKNRHLGTIAQLCRALSSQLRHVSTIGKKLVKQQYLLHMSLQYGELRPTSDWDRFVSLGASQQISTGLASWQRYCTAKLRRWTERYLCSAGRPSRWALAHISSFGGTLLPKWEQSHRGLKKPPACAEARQKTYRSLRSVHPFLHSLPKPRIPMFAKGSTLPQKFPFPLGHLHPI